MKSADKMRGDRRNPGHGIRRRGVRRLTSRYAFTAVILLISSAGARWVSAQAGPSSEYQVKAAFLFHFAQFVEWPPEAFRSANSPLTYCTVGEDPFHGALEASLDGKSINSRPLRVQHYKQVREVRACQVLFIGTPEERFISATLTNLNGNPVLTVGESEHFAQEGGIIGFFLEDNKVRFDINLVAAQKAKLQISARLLALAKTVIGSQKGT
ncbi:MAG: YfiR family protein [Candidatus Acidiferrum sp.]